MTPFRLSSVALIAAAALATSASGQQPRMPVVNITLASHYFAPNPIYLAGGVPTRLIFTNRAGKTHDFHAERFFRNSRILAGRVQDGEVELTRGRATVVDLIPTRGTYNVHCAQPFHKLLGMKAKIIVQ